MCAFSSGIAEDGGAFISMFGVVMRKLKYNIGNIRKTKKERIKVTKGSGNVFADLGLENAEELLAKAQLVCAISDVIKSRKLKQRQIADAMGIDQPKVSDLLRGRTDGYSIDRLLHFLNALDQDVEIVISPKPARVRRAARVSVSNRLES